MARSRWPYRLGDSLGVGAFAEVFEATARDGTPGVVALKRAKPHVELADARLRREIDVQQQLDHPNVMKVLDADPSRTWFTMPLAEGSLLKLWEGGAIPQSADDLAVEMLGQVSSGLEHAHDRGYLHRDITPSNILGFRRDDGGGYRWVVGDWGMVRRPLGETSTPLTDPREGLGTAGFAAPETYDDDAHLVDFRADVYSLGRVVAWLLTGRRPIPNRPLRPDGVLRGFVDECTDLDMERRPVSMGEMMDRLRELTSEPAASPRGEVQALIESIQTDSTAAHRALQVALNHEDDVEIWIDEVARMPLDAVRDLTRQYPDTLAEAAMTMLRTTDWATWGDRDFNYANTPLRWAHEVLRVLTVDGVLGLAEDVATISFERESYLDRWRQHGVTVAWLRSLEEPEGAVIRRAIRRSGARDYYQDAMGSGRIVSRSLAAEFGR